ncbi:MAG: protein kinase, partial [Acidobacteriota bacterium]
MADDLDKVHRQGVVHRDLKPGNIMLVKSGAKLLDFGLAKLQAADTPTNLSALPTEQANLTAEGTILGTLQYMAPEQLEAKEADSRTDIFAFGAVVYEMATGKKAFEGSSQASLIAAIMGQEPRAMSELQPMMPALFDRVVNRCLAKDPDNRWQTSSDLHDELKWIAKSDSTTMRPGAGETTGIHRIGQRVMWVALACLMIGGVVASLAVWNLKPSSALTATVSLGIALPVDHLLTGNISAISPDGTRMAYAAFKDGQSQLYLRTLDEFEARPIPGTEGAENPVFSPGGQWIAFFVKDQGELQKVSLQGGPPLTICGGVGLGTGATWASEDLIIFSPDIASGLMQVSAGGGTPQPLTSPDASQGEIGHWWPQILPNGEDVLFTVDTGQTGEEARIAILSLATGKWRTLISGSVRAQYAASGHLVYTQSGSLLAVPFDAAEQELTGSPVPILEGLYSSWTAAGGHFALSNKGSLIYAIGPSAQKRLVWVDRKGQVTRFTEHHANYYYPRFSPDGKFVAVNEEDQIWIYNVESGRRLRLTLEARNYVPAWTPDGEAVTFGSYRLGSVNLYLKKISGNDPAELLLERPNRQYPMSWFREGGSLLFAERLSSSGGDVWVLHQEGDSDPSPVLQGPFNERRARLSPDGRWLAYVSDESGQDEVYVRPYPGPGTKLPISAGGGEDPIWSADGRELFYLSKNQVVAVNVATTDVSLQADKPHALFEGQFIGNFCCGASYDISPDGQQFLMIQQDGTGPSQINVVLNWFEELKR